VRGAICFKEIASNARLDLFILHSFVKDSRTVTLVPLTPRQVYEDQMKLKRENELKKNCEIESSKKDDEK
jgi:hypothetical protein